MLNASRGGTPDPGQVANSPFPDRPRVDPVKRAVEVRRLRNAAQENCLQAYMKLLEANPDRAPEPRAILEKKMMEEFKVARDEARYCRAKAIQRYNSLHLKNPCKWGNAGR